MNNSQPQIPPIPPVALVDAQGRVTREWWRWFQLVFANQSAMVGGNDLALIFGLQPPDPAPSKTQSAFASHVLDVPPDPVPPLKASAFLAAAIATPPDPPNYKEAIFRSLMLRTPGL